jgi:hypothetical protein
MFGLAALLAASRGRAIGAGLLLGLSFATKVQGLFFAPLVLVFYSPRKRQETKANKFASHLQAFMMMFLSLAAVALIIVVWDRLRGGVPFWIQQTVNYGGIRLIYPSEVWPRLIGWLALLPYLFGPLIGLLGLIGLPIVLRLDLTRDARTRAALIDLALLTYLIALLALHWLLAFPIWDRYLLILVPIAALLLGRIVNQLIELVIKRLPRLTFRRLASLLLSAALMFPYSLTAAQSGYPIGGDHGAYDNIDQVAAYLKTLPSGTVVYDHWLAWELDYYLGEGHVYLAYFDTPAAMADDLRVFAHGDDRYVIFPAYESPARVSDAIGAAGYRLRPVLSTANRFGQTSFTLFKIQTR